MVSRQNVEYLETKPNEDGWLTGGVKIASPEGFWAPSKFLILVEED
jgi:hypothetical protein